MASWHTPVVNKPRGFSELDATEGFAPVAAPQTRTATVVAPRPAPVMPPPPPVTTRRRHSFVVDLVIIAVLGVASVIVAQVVRDAVLRHEGLTTLSLRSGFWWTIATVSWVPLAIAAIVIAAIYALAVRGRGLFVLPLIVGLLLFALPVGAMALASFVAVRTNSPTPAPRQPLDLTDQPAPTVPPLVTLPPSPTVSASSASTASFVAPVRHTAAARASTAPTGLQSPKQPRQPITPPPTTAPPKTKGQTQTPAPTKPDGQHQSQ